MQILPYKIPDVHIDPVTDRSTLDGSSTWQVDCTVGLPFLWILFSMSFCPVRFTFSSDELTTNVSLQFVVVHDSIILLLNEMCCYVVLSSWHCI